VAAISLALVVSVGAPPALGSSSVTCQSADRRLQPTDHFQAVIQAAGPGATLCFKRGIYRLSDPLRPLAGQVLTFEHGAVLSGAKVLKRWTSEGSYWVVGGQTQDFSSSVTGLPDATMCGANPGACIYEDLYMDGRPLDHVTSLDALGPGKAYLDEAGDKMYIATDPTGHTMEATVAGVAITSSASNVTIRGAAIEKFAYHGILAVKVKHWTIKRSDIRYVHFEGIGIHGGSGDVIRNNHVHQNGIIGMTAAGVGHFTIQGNEFDHNNYLNAGPTSGGYHEGSVKILNSHDVVFRDNWSHHNDGDGLWFDWDNYDILIEKNVLEDNTRNGLQYEASFDATVRYNTIRNNGTDWDSQGAGILNSTSKNVEYYSNRIKNNVIRSFVILWADRGSSDKFGERQSANVYFHDNVVVLDDNLQSWVGVYWDQDPRVFTSNNRFQGNTYYVHRDGDQWWRWDSDLTWPEWQSKGFDRTGRYRRG